MVRNRIQNFPVLGIPKYVEFHVTIRESSSVYL